MMLSHNPQGVILAQMINNTSTTYRTQHPGIRDTTQQTRDEYDQDTTTDRDQYEHLDSTRQGSRNKEAKSEGHYDSVSIAEKEKHHRQGFFLEM